MDYINNYEMRETHERFWLTNRAYHILLIRPGCLCHWQPLWVAWPNSDELAAKATVRALRGRIPETRGFEIEDDQ